MLVSSDCSHTGNVPQHRFLWREQAASLVLVIHGNQWSYIHPWPVETLPTTPSMPQRRSGEVAEVLTYREQAAARMPRQGCAGKSATVVATVDHKSMRPDHEPLKQQYFCLK